MDSEKGSKEKIGVGERIRGIRGNDSIPGFANKIGVHKSTLIRYEKEESYPDAKMILSFCALFDINPNWLLTGEGPRNSYPPPIGFSLAMNKLREKVRHFAKTQKLQSFLRYNETARSLTREKIFQFIEGEYFPTDQELQGLCKFAGFDFELVSGERSPGVAPGSKQLVEGLAKTITNITDSPLLSEVIETIENISSKYDIALPVSKKAEMIAIIYDEIAADSSKKETLLERTNRLFKLAL